MFLIKDIRKITPLGKTISEMTAIIQSKIPPIQRDGFDSTSCDKNKNEFKSYIIYK